MMHFMIKRSAAVLALVTVMFAYTVNTGEAKGKGTPEIRVQLVHSVLMVNI